MSALLELDHVTKSFSRGARGRRTQAPVLAVDEVSLEVAPGEIVGLVGESGAGKSTLGRIILGLERADTGTVRFEGTEITRLPERAVRRLRRRMHLVLQDPYESLHPGLTVAEIVAEPLAIAGATRAERGRAAASALDEVGLMPAADVMDRFPHQLSGGQRQRVAFARAIVGRPRLIIADEPTSMLDASLRAGILDLMTGIRDRLGTGFILITHDLAVARHVTDRIAVMHQGRIVECGDTEDVIASPRNGYTLTLLAASEGDL